MQTLAIFEMLVVFAVWRKFYFLPCLTLYTLCRRVVLKLRTAAIVVGNGAAAAAVVAIIQIEIMHIAAARLQRRTRKHNNNLHRYTNAGLHVIKFIIACLCTLEFVDLYSAPYIPQCVYVCCVQQPFLLTLV